MTDSGVTGGSEGTFDVNPDLIMTAPVAEFLFSSVGTGGYGINSSDMFRVHCQRIRRAHRERLRQLEHRPATVAAEYAVTAFNQEKIESTLSAVVKLTL